MSLPNAQPPVPVVGSGAQHMCSPFNLATQLDRPAARPYVRFTLLAAGCVRNSHANITLHVALLSVLLVMSSMTKQHVHVSCHTLPMSGPGPTGAAHGTNAAAMGGPPTGTAAMDAE